jgi:hypothetical protein
MNGENENINDCYEVLNKLTSLMTRGEEIFKINKINKALLLCVETK